MTTLPIDYPAAWRPWIEAFLAVPALQWGLAASFLVLGIFFWSVLISLGGKIGQSDPSAPAWRQWIHTLRWSTANLCFILCLWTGLAALSGFPPAFVKLKSLGFRIAIACVAAGAAIRSANILTQFFQRRFFPEKFSEDEEIALITTRLFRGLILLVAALVILDNLGVKLLGLLAALGFVGGAIALASQSTIANIFGYFEILADGIFRTGDRISFQNYDGFVRLRGLRSIRLESLNGGILTIPNKQFVEQQVRRLTDDQGLSLLTIEVGLLYSYDRARLEDTIRVICEALAARFPGGEPVGRFYEFGESAQKFRFSVRAGYRDGLEFVRDTTAAHLTVREACDKAGISFAFPTRTVALSSPINPSRNPHSEFLP
ncbi:MAG: mechanosensitive ion channel [Verrucomicrobia bacterium]|nr:mechanosensitive ion channel [Verrucomicrobiota bacterium]